MKFLKPAPIKENKVFLLKSYDKKQKVDKRPQFLLGENKELKSKDKGVDHRSKFLLPR